MRAHAASFAPAQAVRRTRRPPALRLGAHTSIAGGLHRALERGAEAGCRVIQIFTRSNQQWRVRPIDVASLTARERARRLHRVEPVMVHGSYLINLAAPERALRKRSCATLVAELARCEMLGIPRASPARRWCWRHRSRHRPPMPSTWRCWQRWPVVSGSARGPGASPARHWRRGRHRADGAARGAGSRGRRAPAQSTSSRTGGETRAAQAVAGSPPATRSSERVRTRSIGCERHSGGKCGSRPLMAPAICAV